MLWQMAWCHSFLWLNNIPLCGHTHTHTHTHTRDLCNGSLGKESTCSAGDTVDLGLIRGSGRSPGEGNGNPLQYFLHEKKSLGQSSLVGYSPEGWKKSDTTQLCSTLMHTHTHVHTDHIFFICLHISGHLHCFLILATVNNAAVSIGLHRTFHINVFIFFR